MMQAQQIDTLSMTTESNSPLLGQLVVDGDTVPWSVLDEMLFVAKPTLSDFQARRNYYILMKKVGRVYPYVREAALRMDSVNIQLEGIDRRRQRRKYTKSYQKYLEERFEPELRKLTRSEGQILSKLVYRETRTSVYQIIKTYRNGLSARFWSMTAWWYDIDLKRPYDPENDAEDQLIENILLRKFISGELVPARADERNIYRR
ncbi:MAG: DUF4294 domain-containing protein [Schleiferiaceae bacterium]|jgi:hypothetical protein|nr:DUF4294 domain-containing protein [Schleiferiaceae bacterium]MDG1312874.1 DUF4294 domain-containing protein [Schleiferiaceae bacterium]MDG1918191.1 DUF4294 domain-containing protein [Schleiferiaceae bacterium]MDG2110445.1 DUF4294 domain-containing protein [Schleiferiaceae bacterium]